MLGCAPDLAQSALAAHRLHSRLERSLRTRTEPLVRRLHGWHGNCDGRIGVVAVELGGHIEGDEVASGDEARAWQAVCRLLIDADAGRARVANLEHRRRASSGVGEELLRDPIKLGGGDPRAHGGLHRRDGAAHHLPRGHKPFQITGSLDGHANIPRACGRKPLDTTLCNERNGRCSRMFEPR